MNDFMFRFAPLRHGKTKLLAGAVMKALFEGKKGYVLSPSIGYKGVTRQSFDEWIAKYRANHGSI